MAPPAPRSRSGLRVAHGSEGRARSCIVTKSSLIVLDPADPDWSFSSLVLVWEAVWWSSALRLPPREAARPIALASCRARRKPGEPGSSARCNFWAASL